MKYVDRLQAADGWMRVGGAKEQVVGCQTVRFNESDAGSSRDNFDELSSDHGLTSSVELQRQFVDHFA